MAEVVRFSGTLKLEVCDRLVDDWPRLADVLDIPLTARQGFPHGRGPAALWEWLEQRRQLDRLAPALGRIGRPDLVDLLGRQENGRAGTLHWQESTRHFTGRHAAIGEIAAWATAADRPPVCFVTGDPGSGKSAVVGWFAVDPEMRQGMLDAPARPRPPDGLVLAAVNARDLSLAAVVDAIGSTARSADDLRADLRRCPPGIIVIDAVDEAADPADLLTRLIEPFALEDAPPVGLLVAGRIQVVPRGYDESRVKIVNLDQAFADPAGIEEYAVRLLSDPVRPETARYRDSPGRTRRVAAAVAQDAASSFLVARLTCMALLERNEVPEDVRQFPRRVGDAMNLYLSSLPDRRLAENLLRPLAFARGSGLPRAIWAHLAGWLAGTPGRYSESDIVALQGSSVQALFRSSRVADRVRYRLFHEALEEHLCTLTPGDPEAPAPGPDMAEAFARALLATVPAGIGGRPDWSKADPYALAHLAQHAAATPVLGLLLRDATFLVHADPGGVLRSLPYADPADGAAVFAYESVASRLRPEDPPAERAAYLALGARYGAEAALALRWEVDGSLRDPAATWWPTAARWRMTRSRVIHEHVDAVAAVRFAGVLGTTMVVSGSADGTLGIVVLPGLWTTAAGGTHDRVVRLGRPVRALGIAMVDRRPLVVAGTDDGNLHLVNLPGGAVLGASARQPGPAVSAVAVRPSLQADLVVAGYEDGILQEWRLFPLAPRLPGTRTDGSEVAAIVPIERYGVAAVTGAGGVWRWDGTGPSGRLPLAAPRVTAMADGDPGALGRSLVTGHDDGSVRLWEVGAGGLREVFLARVPSVVLAVDAVRLDGRLLLVVSHEEGALAVVDVAAGRMWPHGLGGHASPQWDVAGVTVGRTGLVAAGGDDDNVRLWPLKEAEHASPDVDAAPMPSRLAASGGLLLGVGVDDSGAAVVLDAVQGTPIGGLQPPPGHSISTAHITSVGADAWFALGTDGGMFAAGPVGSTLHWHPAGAEDWVIGVAVIAGTPPAGAAAPAPRRRPIAVAVTVDGSVRVVDAGTGSTRKSRDFPLEGLTGVTIVAVDADAGLLAAADRSGRLGCWSIADQQPVVAPFPAHAVSIEALSCRQGTLFLGSRDGRLAVADGTRTADIGRHRRISRILPLSRGIVTGGEDGILRVWWDDRTDPLPVVDLGAPISDILWRPDDPLAVATARGVILLDIPVR